MDIEKKFFEDLALKIKIGFELEFYFTEDAEKFSSKLIADLQQILRPKIKGFVIRKEQGNNQFEVLADPVEDANILIKQINIAKDSITKAVEIYGIKCDFRAVPFIDDCSSSLQISISFTTKDMLICDDHIWHYAIGGLLKRMKQDMHIFSPDINSNIRYDRDRNIKIYKLGKYPAPLNVSWGLKDNRTVAIRLINKDRIEHRVSCANANPQKVVEAILSSVYFGIKNKIEPPKVIYGNAFDSNYNLESLL